MKAPCSKYCIKDIVCRHAEQCNLWREYVRKSKEEREEKEMKCTECHQNMELKENKPGEYYYECPNCHHTVGKPKEVIDDVKKEE